MRAERTILETDEQGRLISVPALPPHARVEAIFLLLDEPVVNVPREPDPELSASIQIMGDIISPVMSPEEWEALH